MKGVIAGSVCHQKIDIENISMSQKIIVIVSHFRGARCGM